MAEAPPHRRTSPAAFLKLEDFDPAARDVLPQAIYDYIAGGSEDEATRAEHYYRRERRLGIMSRHIALPEAVSGSDIHAQLQAGVLTVTLSIPEGRQSQRIHVRDADGDAPSVDGQADPHPGGYSGT